MAAAERTWRSYPASGMSVSFTWTWCWAALKAATCRPSVRFSAAVPVWNQAVMYVGAGPAIVLSQVVSPRMLRTC